MRSSGGIEEKTEKIASKLRDLDRRGLRMFASSSFQTQSLPLLHILARFRPTTEIVFLDTGYHFPETLKFRDEIAQQLGLTVTNAKSVVPKSEQRTVDGQLLFTTDVDQCCYLNKVAPLEPFLENHDVWISGVRADQSKVRATMSKTMPGPNNTSRYHPILDWSAKDISTYRKAHNLPSHPLESQGYLSVGCMPCTRSIFDIAESSNDKLARSGRWVGQTKTECGLHTELIKQETPLS